MKSDSADVAELGSALRRAGLTEVDISTRRRAEYSSDASLYRVVPDAVVYPHDAEDVRAAVAVARELQRPITARGAGTSIAGNAVGPGIVLDYSTHFNRILDLDPTSRTALVQPGVILDDLQRQAAEFGLRFGPDPSTHARATFGGLIGNNACGSRALAYGRTADNVLGLTMVTGTGEQLELQPGANSVPLQRLRDLVRENLALIRTEFGRFTRQVSGYSLEHLLPERGFDVAKAAVGTEGTWGQTLDATVRLVEAPSATLLVVLGYPDMASAADAVPALLPFAPVALEGIDTRIVDVVRRAGGRVPELPAGRGWLFVELGGRDELELLDRAGAVMAAAGSVGALIAADRQVAVDLWRIREDGAGLGARAGFDPHDPRRTGHAGWEDSAVPPAQLGGYLRELEALMADFELGGVPYGHFGDGCLHIRMTFPFDQGRPGRLRFRDFVSAAADLAARHGGSMSGEHGDGRARSELLAKMYSPAALELFGRVKAIFDPDDLMNPGVLVRPANFDANLRMAEVIPLRSSGFRFEHDDGDLSAAVHRCTGVGKCRVTADNGAVMCPSFRATQDEKDSTRGRARVLQEAANGRGQVSRADLLESLDLCLSCKACASDCPTGVDMATYKSETLYQHYRHRLRPMSHYVLGWLPTWARLAARFAGPANAMMQARPLKPLVRLAGVDPRRTLPRLAPQTFQQWFADRPVGSGRPVGTGRPVRLWVDTFTDLFTPQVGRAATEVLEAAGYRVQLSSPGLCCGLTWISTGQLDTARTHMRRAVLDLAPSASAGVPIVGLEPSCTAVFRSDASDLLGNSSPVRAVAGQMMTLAELLSATPGWTAPDLSETELVAQPHCHQHAVMGWSTDEELLREAGADVTRVDGCCGLAGNFGAELGHYDISVAVAENGLLPAVRSAGDDARILTDGFSCRTQLEHLTTQSGIHLAELLRDTLS